MSSRALASSRRLKALSNRSSLTVHRGFLEGSEDYLISAEDAADGEGQVLSVLGVERDESNVSKPPLPRHQKSPLHHQKRPPPPSSPFSLRFVLLANLIFPPGGAPRARARHEFIRIFIILIPFLWGHSLISKTFEFHYLPLGIENHVEVEWERVPAVMEPLPPVSNEANYYPPTNLFSQLKLNTVTSSLTLSCHRRPSSPFPFSPSLRNTISKPLSPAMGFATRRHLPTAMQSQPPPPPTLLPPHRLHAPQRNQPLPRFRPITSRHRTQARSSTDLRNIIH